MAFTPDESARYARHLVLRGFGGAAQQKLKAAKVLVIGAGGIGSPAIAYLAAAGVGTLGVADHDHVAISNLQRQILHTTAALKTPKVESAGRFVAALNPHVDFVRYQTRISAENSSEILAGYDVILDGTDTITARRAIAEAAATLGKPLVSGGVSTFDGQLTVFAPSGPQFADLYPPTATDADVPACELVGVLGPVMGVIGTMMALEAIKLVTGVGDPLIGRLLLYDGRSARFTELSFG